MKEPKLGDKIVVNDRSFFQAVGGRKGKIIELTSHILYIYRVVIEGTPIPYVLARYEFDLISNHKKLRQL